MSFASRLARFYRQRRAAWIARRHPQSAQHKIDKRRIYILPTAACAGFILLLLVMLLLAINYENNLVYALSFLLISVLLVSMVHTHNNLRDLRISARGYEPVFAGERTRYRLHLIAPDHPVVGAHLSYSCSEVGVVTLAPHEECTVELSAAPGERGWHHPGILAVSARYPMGLFRAWSYVNLEQNAWIYPRPEAGGALPPSAAESDADVIEVKGSEEFSGLQEYQPGMSLGRAAWATLARGLALQVKEFSEPVGDSRWLRWSFWPELESEARFSRLCYWVLRLEREQRPFGLELPSKTLPVASGRAQAQAALLALAQEGAAELIKSGVDGRE
jgi:uncharacterized protein (DUF58 family)